VDWQLYAAAGISLIAFLATTPFAALAPQEFIAGAFLDVRHYTGGHAGTTGSSLAWYLDSFWRSEGVMLALCVAGALWGFRRRARPIIWLALMTLAYLLFVSVFSVHAMRMALPLIPLFALLAGAWAVSLQCDPGLSKRHVPGAASALIAIALLFPATTAVREAVRLTAPDSLDTARVWINQNIPAGARIGLESYAPWVDPARFNVQGFYRLDGHDAAWYRAEGYRYLIFSETMFRRFYKDPVRLSADIARYEALFAACADTKVFTDGGYEVRVCELRHD
jgi:hypothetical protein